MERNVARALELLSSGAVARQPPRLPPFGVPPAPDSTAPGYFSVAEHFACAPWVGPTGKARTGGRPRPHERTEGGLMPAPRVSVSVCVACV